MAKHIFTGTFYTILITSFMSCEIIGGIFKTGMGVGIFIVIIVIAMILFFTTRMGKNK